MAVVDAVIADRAVEAVRVIGRWGRVRAAYLFGSQAQGTADQWSDIDVAAFLEGIEDWDLQRRATAMALVMEEAGSNVEAHLLPVSALQKPEPGSFAEHILKHGVRIYGE